MQQRLGLSMKASRAPHGARGLKYHAFAGVVELLSRAPHGARGLKFHLAGEIGEVGLSRPARGAWIEIYSVGFHELTASVAPRTGRVD